jgi:hypothetical protein
VRIRRMRSPACSICVKATASRIEPQECEQGDTRTAHRGRRCRAS